MSVNATILTAARVLTGASGFIRMLYVYMYVCMYRCESACMFNCSGTVCLVRDRPGTVN